MVVQELDLVKWKRIWHNFTGNEKQEKFVGGVFFLSFLFFVEPEDIR